MDLAATLLALLALCASTGIGIVAHELTHVLTLRAFGISCRAQFGRNQQGARLFDLSLGAPLATVTPQLAADENPESRLRIAALMPLLLAGPFCLIPLGIVPDPFLTGNVPMQVAVVGWLACALPSPQDFSIVWDPTQCVAASTQ
jgi:hypothetical protein